MRHGIECAYWKRSASWRRFVSFKHSPVDSCWISVPMACVAEVEVMVVLLVVLYRCLEALGGSQVPAWCGENETPWACLFAETPVIEKEEAHEAHIELWFATCAAWSCLLAFKRSNPTWTCMHCLATWLVVALHIVCMIPLGYVLIYSGGKRWDPPLDVPFPCWCRSWFTCCLPLLSRAPYWRSMPCMHLCELCLPFYASAQVLCLRSLAGRCGSPCSSVGWVWFFSQRLFSPKALQDSV